MHVSLNNSQLFVSGVEGIRNGPPCFRCGSVYVVFLRCPRVPAAPHRLTRSFFQERLMHQHIISEQRLGNATAAAIPPSAAANTKTSAVCHLLSYKHRARIAVILPPARQPSHRSSGKFIATAYLNVFDHYITRTHAADDAHDVATQHPQFHPVGMYLGRALPWRYVHQ